MGSNEDRGSDEATRRHVLACLADADTPLGALEVGRRTHLSTLVVIPVLGQLVEDSLITRGPLPARPGDRRATWCYQLTGRGSRALQRAAAR